MPLKFHRVSILLGMLAALAVVGCSSGPAAAPTTERTPTQRPFVTAPADAPTAALAPVALSPTNTPGMVPTVAATAFQDVMVNFPSDVNPLTGEAVASPEVLNHIPLLIKVSNSPAIVRPQDGLSSADLVFEHLAEGGVTRFTALFWDRLPQRVGSNRSMRLIDLELPDIYQAFLAYSGSSAGVHQRLLASDFYAQGRAISPELGQGPPIFNRINNGKAWEHTLFVDPQAMRAEAARRGIDKRPDLTGMGFSITPPDGGVTATQITIAYPIQTAFWKYDGETNRYLRWDDGVANSDRLTGQQLSSANVVALFAPHVFTNILEDNVAGGHRSIEIQLSGSGPMKLFRDGKVYAGTWHRDPQSSMLTFTGSDGQVLPFQVGNTWIELVPTDFVGLKVK